VTGLDNTAELAAFLAGVPFFAALDETAREQLAQQLEPVQVAAGQLVVAQGEPGEGLFIVVSGRLRVSVSAGGTERALHDLARGAIVGEIALLSNLPRSATVRAVRDSDLLLLRQSSFTVLVEQTPRILHEISRLLIDRLLAVDRPQLEPTGNRTIAVIPAGQNPEPAMALARALTEELARAGSVLRVDAGVVEERLGPGAAQREPGDRGRGELTAWLHSAERAHDRVVYQADPDETAWSRLCLSQADVVLMAADASADGRLGPVERRALATESLRRELVLRHSARPSGTAAWLRSRSVAAHHHLQAGNQADVARLARLVTGTACGVVLGGGGPRGFAHLGVLRALDEAGIPVDLIGGTSIGAVMGALSAQGLPDDERVERAITAFTRSGRLVSPTLPMIALSSGRRVDRLLAEHLGATLIEDLPRRFFCVSANLTRAVEVVHDSGPLWRAVRASLSLPGIFPPIYADGDLLVDGGALNNVPVDVMRARLGSGSLIAVDLTPDVEPATTAPFDLGLSGWRVLGGRLSRLSSGHRLPGVVDILSRSAVLSGVKVRRAALTDQSIDLLLRPPVAGIGALDFKAGVRLIDVGYQHAVDALTKSDLTSRFAR
jgi:predicted acylesterase/phospholipase RssA/CRP-like cAMP-binding protein